MNEEDATVDLLEAFINPSRFDIDYTEAEEIVPERRKVRSEMRDRMIVIYLGLTLNPKGLRVEDIIKKGLVRKKDGSLLSYEANKSKIRREYLDLMEENKLILAESLGDGRGGGWVYKANPKVIENILTKSGMPAEAVNNPHAKGIMELVMGHKEFLLGLNNYDELFGKDKLRLPSILGLTNLSLFYLLYLANKEGKCYKQHPEGYVTPRISNGKFKWQYVKKDSKQEDRQLIENMLPLVKSAFLRTNHISSKKFEEIHANFLKKHEKRYKKAFTEKKITPKTAIIRTYFQFISIFKFKNMDGLPVMSSLLTRGATIYLQSEHIEDYKKELKQYSLPIPELMRYDQLIEEVRVLFQ